MFFLCALLFLFFIYTITQFFPSKKLIDSVINKEYYTANSKNNIIILSKLGYYNINPNATKTSFISECMNYLLYAHNPNYTELYNFTFDDFNVGLDAIEDLYTQFQKLCISSHKYRTDFTISEITNFIKSSDIYKKLDQELGYKLRRAICLSKFTNDLSVNKLIDSLTLKELEMLENVCS
jgi:hypothetical protein